MGFLPFLQVKKRRSPAKGQCSLSSLQSLQDPSFLKIGASNSSSKTYMCSTSRLALVIIFICVLFLCKPRRSRKKRLKKLEEGERRMPAPVCSQDDCCMALPHNFLPCAHRAGCHTS